MPCKNAVLVFLALSSGLWADADTSVAWLQQGKALAMQGEAMSAVPALRRAGASNDPALRQMAAFWLDYTGQDALIEKERIDGAFSASSAGNLDEAVVIAEEALSKDPFSYDAHIALAKVYRSYPQSCMGCYWQSIPNALKHEILVGDALSESVQKKLDTMRMLHAYYLMRVREFQCSIPCCPPEPPTRPCYRAHTQAIIDYGERAEEQLERIHEYEQKVRDYMKMKEEAQKTSSPPGRHNPN